MTTAERQFQLNVNGKDRAFTAHPDMPLLWVLRDTLGLKGAKYGCGKGLCGSCTVHLDGKPVRSCTLPVGATRGKVTTVEGLADDHPVIAAWETTGRAAMRLLPAGPDHERGGPAGRHPPSR